MEPTIDEAQFAEKMKLLDEVAKGLPPVEVLGLMATYLASQLYIHVRPEARSYMAGQLSSLVNEQLEALQNDPELQTQS